MSKLHIVKRSELLNTSRHVQNEHYESIRFLLAEDNAGVTLTDITLSPGKRATYGYDQHIEVAYCLSGRAEIVDLSDGQKHLIEAGSLWVASKGSRFEFVAHVATRIICAFTPPFTGRETGFAGDQ